MISRQRVFESSQPATACFQLSKRPEVFSFSMQRVYFDHPERLRPPELEIEEDPHILLWETERLLQDADRKLQELASPKTRCLRERQRKHAARNPLYNPRTQARFDRTTQKIISLYAAGETVGSIAKTCRRSTARIRAIVRENVTGGQLVNPVVDRWRTDVDLVRTELETQSDKFFTSGSLKRKIDQKRTLSKKRICRILKTERMNFVNNSMTISQFRKTKRPVDQVEIKALIQIANVLTTSLRGNRDLYMLDEFKLVFTQNPLKAWKEIGNDKLIERTSPSMETATCIMLCSATKIECFQIFGKELKAKDTLVFLAAFFNQLKLERKDLENVLIFMDQARWHLAKEVATSEFIELICYNLVKRPELNLIEVLFSKLRQRFRSRKQVETLEDEIASFWELTLDCDKLCDFLGYQKQVLRSLHCMLSQVLGQRSNT